MEYAVYNPWQPSVAIGEEWTDRGIISPPSLVVSLRVVWAMCPQPLTTRDTLEGVASTTMLLRQSHTRYGNEGLRKRSTFSENKAR